MDKMKTYLSLPISGYDREEREEYAEGIVAKFPDIEFVNPMEMSRELDKKREEAGLSPATWKDYLDEDKKVIPECQQILFTENWRKSTGCMLEYMWANKHGLKKLYLNDKGEIQEKYFNWDKDKDNKIKTCYELFGIECGEGWSELYEPIIAKVHEFNEGKTDEEKIYIHQIKEKFGGLRVYLSSYTEELSKMVDAAEEASFHTCEFCGKPGKERSDGWIYTLCDDCWAELQEKKKNRGY